MIVGQSLWDVKLVYDQNELPFYTFVYQYAQGFDLSKMLGTQLKYDQTLIRPPLVELLNDTVKELNVVWNAPISKLCGKNKVDLVRHHNLIATLVEISVTNDLWAYLSIYHFARETSNNNLNYNDNTVNLLLASIQESLRTASELLDVHAEGFYGNLYNEIYVDESDTKWLYIVNVAKEHLITLVNSVRVNQITTDDLTDVEKSIYKIDGFPLIDLNLKEYVDKIKEKLGAFIFSLY